MATIIKDTKKYAMSKWKQGLQAGTYAGLFQGFLGMFLHPFVARLGGGVIASSIVKNPIDKRIINNECAKESIYQILAGE